MTRVNYLFFFIYILSGVFITENLSATAILLYCTTFLSPKNAFLLQSLCFVQLKITVFDLVTTPTPISSPSSNFVSFRLFVCVEVLRPSQPNGVMSSAVSLPNHTFTGQA